MIDQRDKVTAYLCMPWDTDPLEIGKYVLFARSIHRNPIVPHWHIIRPMPEVDYQYMIDRDCRDWIQLCHEFWICGDQTMELESTSHYLAFARANDKRTVLCEYERHLERYILTSK